MKASDYFSGYVSRLPHTAVALTLLFGGSVVWAQDQDANSDESESPRIEEVIVTAQKREQNLQSTPLAVSAISGDEIIRTAKSSLAEVLNDFAAVEVQGLAQGAQVYIRSVGSSIDPMFADPAIALMVDGVYNGRTESVTAGAYDVNRIEALRGPQGTLYGRNASGGVINVITNDPSLDGFNGYAYATAGNYSLWRGEAAVNIPLGDTVALRIAGVREKRDGYIDDGGNDSDFWGVRTKLLFEPNDRLRMVFKIDVFDMGGAGQNVVPVDGSAGNLFFPPPFFVENFDPTLIPPFGPPGYPVLRFPNGWEQRNPGDPWSNNPEHVAGFIDRRSESYSAVIDADLGFGTLTILPSYSKNKNRLVSSYLFGSIVPFVGPTYDLTAYGDQFSEVDYTSIEARLASHSDGPFDYVAGLYWLDSDQKGASLPNETFTPSGDLLTVTNTIQPAKTLAAFGQLTYSITDRFRLTGGLRYSKDKSGQGYSYELTSPGGTDANAYTYDDKVTSWQYKAGLEYDVAEQALFYAHVATGFKQGGISPTFPPTPFNPEDLIAYEMGLKSRFWSDRAQVNLAAFHYDYNDYQFSYFEEQPVGDFGATANFIVIGNAGDTSVDGFEVESQLLAWEGGLIKASVAYLDAKYGTAILPNNPFVNQGEFDLGGRQIQNAPKWSGDVGIQQSFNVFDGSLTLEARMHFSNGYYVTPEQYLPGAYQDSFTRSDLNARYDSGSGAWYVGAFLKNIEDDAQTTYVFPAYRRFVTNPRTYGVIVGFNF